MQWYCDLWLPVNMKDFEYYIKEREVKIQTPNKIQSLSIFKSAKARLEHTKKFPVLKEEAKYILEDSYDAIREACDSLLIRDGYKSYSHIASIIYLRKFKFEESDLRKINRFRKLRNGIKYYGEDVELKDAVDALFIAEKIITKIKKLI